ncbi:hypothetical protein BJY18_005565 [Amycolatopsis jiangsuensis]|uniref:Uncharacterized protein n=1 Tax=Amycolatopsis jiangsuensis TaxID=1181879 RepID=A0A840J1Z8_9PSEU|nr:hypothetical protein [Amycolatopsis jiangsuensis]
MLQRWMPAGRILQGRVSEGRMLHSPVPRAESRAAGSCMQGRGPEAACRADGRKLQGWMPEGPDLGGPGAGQSRACGGLTAARAADQRGISRLRIAEAR